eukprot:2610263-Rhodomonas_salina.1
MLLNSSFLTMQPMCQYPRHTCPGTRFARTQQRCRPCQDAAIGTLFAIFDGYQACNRPPKVKPK